MFVYSITNTINGKRYIGKTEGAVESRWNGHMYDLNRDKHYNEHLQRAWNKYGAKAFTFEVLDQAVFVSGLNNLECFWIQFLKTFDPNYGYNKTFGGEGTRGWKHSEETLKKMRAKIPWNRSKKTPGQVKKKLSAAGKGKPLSEHQKARIAEAVTRWHGRRKQL